VLLNPREGGEVTVRAHRPAEGDVDVGASRRVPPWRRFVHFPVQPLAISILCTWPIRPTLSPPDPYASLDIAVRVRP